MLGTMPIPIHKVLLYILREAYTVNIGGRPHAELPREVECVDKTWQK